MLRDDAIGLLGKDSAEDQIAGAIDFVKQFPAHRSLLLGYLRQQHPIYQGKSANQVIRLRGYLFASFMRTGVEESALPFVLEVLETGRQAYIVAGAAMALRGLPSPDPQFVPYLLKAFGNMKFLDDAVSFETYKPRWPVANQTTALAEICRTLQWMGPCAAGSVADLKQLCGDIYVSDKIKSELQKVVALIEEEEGKQPFHACCDLIVRRQHNSSRSPQRRSDVVDLVLEDHTGNSLTYSAYFCGKPAIVVFFYTRCDNPNKCSSTITRLGELQSALIDAGLENEVRIAAVTYDPLYDLPFRLDSYCRNRGMVLNDDNRAFRIPTGMTQMLRYFDSGVSYIGSIVNQHATELFIVDSDGQIANRFQQLQWQVPEVMTQLRKQLSRDRRQKEFLPSLTRRMRDIFSFIVSLSIAFFPKCPLCWASYVSVVGITDIQMLEFTPWLLPALVGLLMIHLFSLLKRAGKRNGLLPFFLSLWGAFCILFFGLWMNMRIAGYAGTVLITAGSVLNSLDPSVFTRMRLRIMQLRSVLHSPYESRY